MRTVALSAVAALAISHVSAEDAGEKPSLNFTVSLFRSDTSPISYLKLTVLHSQQT